MAKCYFSKIGKDIHPNSRKPSTFLVEEDNDAAADPELIAATARFGKETHYEAESILTMSRSQASPP
jgi:hypothetical protein